MIFRCRMALCNHTCGSFLLTLAFGQSQSAQSIPDFAGEGACQSRSTAFIRSHVARHRTPPERHRGHAQACRINQSPPILSLNAEIVKNKKGHGQLAVNMGVPNPHNHVGPKVRLSR